jgi:hypothetical protein
MKAEPVKLDLSKTEVLELKYKGVPVSVRVDANGWPLTVTKGCWLGGDEERIAAMATTGALEELRRRALLKVEADGHARRTAISTKAKQDKAAAFWGNEWLEHALPRCPNCRPNSRDSTTGDHPLALAARNMIEEKAEREPEFKKHHDYKHRAQIKNYRARKFLESRLREM